MSSLVAVGPTLAADCGCGLSAERMERRLLTPGLCNVSYARVASASVTAFRIFLATTSAVSVMRILEFTSGALFDILLVGSLRLSTLFVGVMICCGKGKNLLLNLRL